MRSTAHQLQAWGSEKNRTFDVVRPDPTLISIETIAHSLSMQCRFNGHCNAFYSVAQHSVLVSQVCMIEDARWGLLHDASEAYLGDVIRPLKHHPMFAFYRDVERQLQEVIYRRFSLFGKEPPSVEWADEHMLRDEAVQLMAPLEPLIWPPNYYGWEYVKVIHPLDPIEAERLFLRRFDQLFTDAKFAQAELEL